MQLRPKNSSSHSGDEFSILRAEILEAIAGTHLDCAIKQILCDELAFLPEADNSCPPAVSTLLRPTLLSPSECLQVTGSQIASLTEKRVFSNARTLQDYDWIRVGSTWNE
jgi:hypothetical protein